MWADFIISGIVAKIIKHEIGKISEITAIIVIPYAMAGNTHKIEHEFCFPRLITSVFLPFALSAS